MRKTLVALGVGLTVIETVWMLWKYRNYFSKQKRDRRTIADVIFFTNKCLQCRMHANSRIACSDQCPVASVKKIIYYISSSRKTLDICMYLLTSKDIIRAIIKQHERNVVVRLIVDGNMSENGAFQSQIKILQDIGIRVKITRTLASLMHHKFAIIDEDVMIYGSTNWTMQAFYGNFDGIIITNDSKFVKPFNEEFGRMWASIK